ncbi:hypothetical protein BUALT_Bualt03G0139400 [Buddleja alternifolia]|uniref:Uncharacterized protein n=1 Tax=Buddleja alternifolia TaxID=168488 RepID=A0AAV6Y1N7_9LAMI|nr:hypothetical protein BUALT_Bualt03G0139400 [Buddleja alternifolia]
MGGSGSSSKRKSSKKKSLKTSSQKKKSRRKESKKRHRAYDSVSSYSDDESLSSESPNSKSDYKRRQNKHKKVRRDHSVSSINSDSDSLSTYDNSYKNKKKARRSRIKSNKKRTKKRHDSPDSDAKAQNVRKRKDHVVKPRKKSSKKKKSKKHVSSSSSSDSESDHTFLSSSSSSSLDRKRKRNKVTLDKEIERPRGRESHKTHKKRKTRSPSCSSRGTGGDHSISVDHSDGALAPVNNSRRLRSVITFVDQPRDEGENKEEIVYDYDDYPSPKSMDSNEGGCKRESDNYSHGAFDEKFCVENVVGEEVTELGKSGVEDDQNNVHINKSEKENEGLGGDDLELILRQKALENLRKFRSGIQTTGSRSTTDLKMNNESDVNGLSPGKFDIVQNKSTNQSFSPNAREMNQSSGPKLERDSSRSVDIEEKPNSVHIEQEPRIAKQTSDNTPDGAAILGFSEEDKAKHISGSDASPEAGATNACSSSTVKMTEPTSSVGPISGDQNLEEQQNEAQDGSEFKQKTMSVMRGGEMVQVSYKVYIPKKAPALARRQLRR